MATQVAPHKRALALLGLVLCLVVAGCGNGGSTGGIKAGPGVDVGKKTIDLGVLSPLSGTVGQLIGIPLTQGIEVYFKDINDNGGIDGFKVNLVEKDNMYPNVQTQVQDYNEIHNQVLMLAESLGTPTTHAIIDQVNADHMLTSAATLDSDLARQPYMMLIGTPYRLQVENAFDYVVNKLGVASPKTAIIYQDDTYGQDGLTGYHESMAAYHLNDVGQIKFTPGGQDYTAQVAQLKASGAKYVFVTATPADAGLIVGTAAALGYLPQWIFQSPAWHPILLTNAKLAPVLEHFVWVMGQGVTWGDTSVPGMVKMLADIQKYQPSEQPSAFFAFGYTEAIITAAVLKKAADNKDLTRAGLLNAFNSIGSVDLMGLLPNPTYGSAPNQRVPTRDNIIAAPDPTTPGGAKIIAPDFTGSAAMASQF